MFVGGYCGLSESPVSVRVVCKYSSVLLQSVVRPLIVVMMGRWSDDGAC